MSQLIEITPEMYPALVEAAKLHFRYEAERHQGRYGCLPVLVHQAAHQPSGETRHLVWLEDHRGQQQSFRRYQVSRWIRGLGDKDDREWIFCKA